jgi:hypothetical protein
MPASPPPKLSFNSDALHSEEVLAVLAEPPVLLASVVAGVPPPCVAPVSDEDVVTGTGVVAGAPVETPPEALAEPDAVWAPAQPARVTAAAIPVATSAARTAVRRMFLLFIGTSSVTVRFVMTLVRCLTTPFRCFPTG